MAKSPLILAALAKDAAPHLDFSQVKQLTAGTGGAFDSALLTATSGDHFTIKLPRNASAGTALEVELRALSALTAEVRAKLPFEITQVVGETRETTGKRAVLFKFVYGDPSNPAQLSVGSKLADSVARAIAAIHSIDRQVIDNAGLPNLSIAEILKLRISELDRIAATGRVPSALLTRWETALEDVSIFHFQTCVIHGGLNADSLLNLDDEVSGALGWSSLRVSDPAEDFAWIFGTGLHENNDALLRSYLSYRDVVDHGFKARAILYSELELGRWLLHGIAISDQAIIDDAVAMLSVLADEVQSGSISKLAAGTGPAAVLSSSLIEPDVVEDYAATAFASPAAEPVSNEDLQYEDLQTKPIELPEKSDNELF